MDSLLTGFQDLISNPLSTPVGQLLEKATNSEEPSENWAMYMEICDIINETEEGPRDAIRAIRKLLANNVGKNNVATLYTLTILETCVKNCGRKFHLQIVQKEFLQELVKIVTNKANAIVVIDRVLNLLQTWSDAFQGVEELREVSRVVNELKEKGVEFPMTDLDMVSPIHTPARSTKPSASSVQSDRVPAGVTQAEQGSSTTSEESYNSDDVTRNISYDHLNYSVPAEDPVSEVRLSDEQKAKLRSDLDIVTQNCSVMGEMLTELTPGHESADDWQLLQELNKACRSMQMRIVSLIDQVQDEDVTNVLLHVNDEVVNVLLRFDRFERLRSGQSNHSSSDHLSTQQTTGTTGTLIDIGDSSGGKPEQSKTESGEFDMFAASRQSYENNQQALQQQGAVYQRDDQMSGGLAAAMNTKSQSDPYQSNVEKGNVKVAPSRQAQMSATSSEFDQFLAMRASAGDQPSAAVDSDPNQAQKSVQPVNRTIKKQNDEESMFSL